MVLLLLPSFCFDLGHPLVSCTSDNMREIVHVQVGQCGNQIGSKVIVALTYSGS